MRINIGARLHRVADFRKPAHIVGNRQYSKRRDYIYRYAGGGHATENKPGVIGAAQVAIHILYAIFGEHRNITLFDDR